MSKVNIGLASVFVPPVDILGSGLMLNERAEYTANVGMVSISTANSNLDGSGTLGTVLTAADNGTLVKTVTIKAQRDVSQGMVRLFLTQDANTRILMEVEIPPTDQSSKTRAFSAVLPLNLVMKSGQVLKASTELNDIFDVTAEGLDFSYPA